jgi:hypothetical protein
MAMPSWRYRPRPSGQQFPLKKKKALEAALRSNALFKRCARCARCKNRWLILAELSAKNRQAVSGVYMPLRQTQGLGGLAGRPTRAGPVQTGPAKRGAGWHPRALHPPYAIQSPGHKNTTRRAPAVFYPPLAVAACQFLFLARSAVYFFAAAGFPLGRGAERARPCWEPVPKTHCAAVGCGPTLSSWANGPRANALNRANTASTCIFFNSAAKASKQAQAVRFFIPLDPPFTSCLTNR